MKFLNWSDIMRPKLALIFALSMIALAVALAGWLAQAGMG